MARRRLCFSAKGRRGLSPRTRRTAPLGGDMGEKERRVQTPQEPPKSETGIWSEPEKLVQ